MTDTPRPSFSPSIEQGMVSESYLKADPTTKVAPGLYDFDGEPIPLGTAGEDPNVIGPDDTPEFRFRAESDYPDVPPQVKKAEHQYVLPLAKFLADSIGITVIDDHAYNKVLKALQSRSLFVVLNLYKTRVSDGEASWFGLVLQCRRHPVVLVQFRQRLSTEQIGISQVRVWSARDQKYYVYGEPGKFLSREVAGATILNYLKREGILPDI